MNIFVLNTMRYSMFAVRGWLAIEMGRIERRAKRNFLGFVVDCRFVQWSGFGPNVG
jgi:hypothetical protein